MSHRNHSNYNSKIPPIGSRSPPQQPHHTNFHTIKHSPKTQKVLNQQPPRKLISIKQNPSALGTPIVKPINTPKKATTSSNTPPTPTNNNEIEIRNCISDMDEIFKDISVYLQSPEFKETFGSIPIPQNLISDE